MDIKFDVSSIDSIVELRTGCAEVLTFVTGDEFCNLLGLKVYPAALGGSWFYAPFEGVTVKPPALPVVLDLNAISQVEHQARRKQLVLATPISY